jgi:hypothetical protein
MQNNSNGKFQMGKNHLSGKYCSYKFKTILIGNSRWPKTTFLEIIVTRNAKQFL